MLQIKASEHRKIAPFQKRLSQAGGPYRLRGRCPRRRERQLRLIAVDCDPRHRRGIDEARGLNEPARWVVDCIGAVGFAECIPDTGIRALRIGRFEDFRMRKPAREYQRQRQQSFHERPPCGHVAAHHKYQNERTQRELGGSSGLSSCGDKATGLTDALLNASIVLRISYRRAHAMAHKRFHLMPIA